MFCLSAALAICCESFRTTVLQTSKAPHHTDRTSREAEGTPHFCLHVRACLGPRRLCQCRFPHDQMICVCCWEGGESVWLKTSLLREVGNKDTNSTMSSLHRTRGPGTCGRKHQDYLCSPFFSEAAGELRPCTWACFHCWFRKLLTYNPQCNCTFRQTVNETAGPCASSAVTDMFTQNNLIQN